MVDDKYSCIKEVTKVVHITLPTACTSNEISGISDVLESWKRQYIQQLQAVVVGYKNVSLTSFRGYIKLDYPFVLHDVKATFELFYPTVGSIVKGKINRISHDYIGCLVHNTINVTIDRSSYTSNFSHFVALDRFILFEITRLDYKRKIIHVKGKITEECARLMRESGLLTDSGDNDNLFIPAFTDSKEGCKELKSDVCSYNSTSLELSTDSGHHSPKKKKSKKARSTSPDKSLSPCSTIFNSSLELENLTDTSSLSSIKKKKHKKIKQELLTSPPLFSESLKSEANSLLSSPSKKKKHKKSKEHSLKSEKNKIDLKSPSKKRSKSESLNIDFKNYELPLKIKKEMHSDSQSSFAASPKKSIRNSNNFSEKNCSDVYEMMEALSSYEPSLEAQLLNNEVSLSSVKEKPLDTTKIAKKRKRESSGVDSLPKKKRKIKDGSSSNKEKSHKKRKKTDKSKKDRKKDKEKKSKLKVISTKKKLHGYKNKLKKKIKEKPEKKKKSTEKPEKSKTKKKKSVKQKTKDVHVQPSSVSFKSEIN